jgi:hypothetical protein
MAGQILNVRPWSALPTEQTEENSALQADAHVRARVVQEVLNCMHPVPEPAYLAKLRQEVQKGARFTKNGNRGFIYTVALLEPPKGHVRRGDVIYHASALPLVDQTFKAKRVIVKQKRFQRFSEAALPN